MLGVAAAGWWLGVGGACQFLGVVLLIVGLNRTRRAFDHDREGLAAALARSVRDGGRGFYRRLTRLWARLTRRGQPEIRLGSASITAAATVTADLSVVPHLDTSDPIAAIKQVHQRLFEVRDGLAGEIIKVKRESTRLVQAEAVERAADIGNLRDDLWRLALGGLANEAWAAVLILVGAAITTVASLLG